MRQKRWMNAIVLALALLAGWWLPAPAAAQPRTDGVYAEMLAAAGLQVIHREDADLTGDGEPETLLLAVGEGCGSCHSQRLVIFAGPRPLADVPLDDPLLEVVPGVGVWITQPVRLPDEPFCCPSASYTLQLLWDATVRVVEGIDVPGQFVWGAWVSTGYAQDDPRAPLYSVATYYALLDAGAFEPAYLLLSSGAQARTLFPDWLPENRPRGAIFPVELARVPQTSGQVRAVIHEVEPLPGQERGSLSYLCTGIWQTVPEADTWLLDTFLVPEAESCAAAGGRLLEP